MHRTMSQGHVSIQAVVRNLWNLFSNFPRVFIVFEAFRPTLASLVNEVYHDLQYSNAVYSTF